MEDPFAPWPAQSCADRQSVRSRPGAGDRTVLLPGRAALLSRMTPKQLPPLPLERLQGLNPLLSAAAPLLLLAGQLRGRVQPTAMAGLRRQVLIEIGRFEEQCRASSVPDKVMLAARYVLCAVIDEAALPLSWEAQDEWAQQSLLMQLHGEAAGGKKFFDVLDGIKVDPAQHIDLMELMYACLAIGFQGMYAARERGSDHLEQIQRDLYQRVRNFRAPVESRLAPHWQGEQDRRNPLIRFVPWWVVAAAALVVVTATLLAYRLQLARAAAPLQAQLAEVGLDEFVDTPAPAVRTVASLRELLASEVERGAVQVDEEGGRTRVTLTEANLFASASATLNSQHGQMLGRVAQALNAVPGRILVVGHTDDQPLKSLKYADNFELSRQRALSVVAALKPQITQAARIEWTGVGSTQPLYQPAATAPNRARNRRVEIVHMQPQD
jgi:type VI secretion system protein ImpK